MLYMPTIAAYMGVRAMFQMSWMLPMTLMQMAMPALPAKEKQAKA
jgi:hypothetical protein